MENWSLVIGEVKFSYWRTEVYLLEKWSFVIAEVKFSYGRSEL